MLEGGLLATNLAQTSVDPRSLRICGLFAVERSAQLAHRVAREALGRFAGIERSLAP